MQVGHPRFFFCCPSGRAKAYAGFGSPAGPLPLPHEVYPLYTPPPARDPRPPEPMRYMCIPFFTLAFFAWIWYFRLPWDWTEAEKVEQQRVMLAAQQQMMGQQALMAGVLAQQNPAALQSMIMQQQMQLAMLQQAQAGGNPQAHAQIAAMMQAQMALAAQMQQGQVPIGFAPMGGQAAMTAIPLAPAYGATDAMYPPVGYAPPAQTVAGQPAQSGAYAPPGATGAKSLDV